MPRVLSYTPSWLCRPSPGFELFSPTISKSKALTRVTDAVKDGGAGQIPRKTIACRGTEVFVVVGNELRWSDLVMLSEKGGRAKDLTRPRAGSRTHSRVGTETPTGVYRVLRVPFSGQITQLSISPNNEYMAISTAHTIHIAILPDPSHLGVNDFGPLRLKTFQLGPTAHVVEQSPLASILWHPLGVDGRCIVTVTEDATLRLWEVNKDNRSSFSEPALSFDLKKLANASNAEDDLRASAYGKGKGFSPDSAELEVAAACFGRRTDFDDGCVWPAMTLWIATTEGDLYALCPLLPSKWQLRSSVSRPNSLAGLTASITSRSELVLKSDSADETMKRNSLEQRQWLSELLEQPPTRGSDKGSLNYIDIYARPGSIPAIPRLQGPFQLTPEVDFDSQVTDVFVTALRESFLEEDIAQYEDLRGEDEYMLASIICLSTGDGGIHICLDLEGVEAKWLPSTKGLSQLFERTLRLSSSRNTPTQRDGFLVPEDDSSRPLLMLETISLQVDNSTSLAPFFTADVRSTQGVFITHQGGIFHLSLSPWAKQLSEELIAAQEEGSEFRLTGILEVSRTLIQTILKFPSPVGTSYPPLVCTVLEDSDLGYFLLAGMNGQPFAATLDMPDSELFSDVKFLEPAKLEQLSTSEPRLSYQPPDIFWQESALINYYKDQVPTRQKRAFAEEIKLSPAALDILTTAHRILSQETHQLGVAAADLFRRCERLQAEFRDQLQKASELANRIDRITGDDEEFGRDEDIVVGNERVERRLEIARARQDELVSRYEAVKMKLAKVGGRELSKSEMAWAEEVNRLGSAVIGPKDVGEMEEVPAEDGETALWERLERVKRLKSELIAQAKRSEGDEIAATRPETVRVPAEVKKQRATKVMELLERETALVNATAQRLDALKAGALAL